MKYPVLNNLLQYTYSVHTYMNFSNYIGTRGGSYTVHVAELHASYLHPKPTI